MKILVVYDSYFGNTEKVAQVIGESFGDDVPVLRVGDVKLEQLSELDYLIVGSPTRAFRSSDAIKAFLGNIPSDGLKGVKVAAFDTRIAQEDVDNPSEARSFLICAQADQIISLDELVIEPILIHESNLKNPSLTHIPKHPDTVPQTE